MKVVRDTWLVFGRYWGLFIHNPVWVAIGVVQPLLYLLLFAPLRVDSFSCPSARVAIWTVEGGGHQLRSVRLWAEAMLDFLAGSP